MTLWNFLIPSSPRCPNYFHKVNFITWRKDDMWFCHSKQEIVVLKNAQKKMINTNQPLSIFLIPETHLATGCIYNNSKQN